MKKETIYPLTSLRFLFAFAVFLSHLKISWTTELFGDLKPLVREGFIGVSFFYILSGFILSYNYEARLLSGDISRKDFYIARLARIWPMHLVTFLAFLPIAIALAEGGAMQFLLKMTLNAFMLQSLVPVRDFFFSFNSPSWSISNECIFYLLFPLLIPFLKKGKWSYIVVTAYFVLFLAGMYMAAHNWGKNLQRGFFYINPFLRLTDFLIGILLFTAYRKFSTVTARISTNMASIIELVCLVVLAIAIAGKGHFPEIYRFSPYYWVPMAVIIFAFAHDRGLFSRMLSNKVAVLLGEISFSFYLWHFVVIDYVEMLDKRFDFNDIQNALISFMFTLGLSYFSYRFIEKTANRYIRRKFGKVPSVADKDEAELVQEPSLVFLPQDAAK